jgi:hypothetical protein
MKGKRYYLRPEFWALMIVFLAGMLHVIHRLNFSFTEILENYWPAIFILVGIFQIASSRYRDTVSITLLILVGTLLLLVKSGVLASETFQEYWPASIKKLLEVIFQSIAYIIDI